MSIDQTIAKAIAAGWIDCFVQDGKVWGYATVSDVIPQVFPEVEKFVTFQEVNSIFSPRSSILIHSDRTREERRQSFVGQRAILEFQDWQCRGVLLARPIRWRGIDQEYNTIPIASYNVVSNFAPEILSHNFADEIRRLYQMQETTMGRIKTYLPQEEREWNNIYFIVRSLLIHGNGFPVSRYNAILEIRREI
jgi:hypothetical protein